MNPLSAIRSTVLCGGLTLGAACSTPAEPAVDSGADAAIESDATPADDAHGLIPLESIPGHESLAQDTSPKRRPRIMPVETYMRSYLALFGAASPLQVQTAIRARDPQLFDVWADYLASLGLPDYQRDVARPSQTSPLMIAALERTGAALCDMAVLRELDATTPPPVPARTVFAFDAPASLDAAGFATRFDVLHRTFLGYPASLAPSLRTQRFWEIYQSTAARYAAPSGAPSTRFRVKTNTGWAAVCYGLLRHPEFQQY